MADLARLDELRRLFADQPRRYFAPLASALRRAGDPREAAAVARAQLAEQPDHLTGHVILGQALLDANDAAGARAAFERAHRVDDGNVVALGALVRLARDAGDAAAAAHWTARLLEADPEPAGARAEAPPADAPDAVAPVDAFELLDFAEVPAPVEPAAELAAEPAAEPARPPLDPVVGLDEAPADPLPEAMRDALPALLDAGPALVPGEAALGEAARQDTEPSVSDETPEPPPPAAAFVTETMAGLLAAQGHTAQALDVYARLLAQRPGDAGLQARVDALRRPGAPVATDDQAAAMWRAAFAPVGPAAAPAAGHDVTPDHPTLDDLSFDRFFEAFGDEPDPVPAEAPGEFERWAAEIDAAPPPVTAGPAHAAPAAPAPAPAAAQGATPADDPDADLAAFNAWLRGVDG